MPDAKRRSDMNKVPDAIPTVQGEKSGAAKADLSKLAGWGDLPVAGFRGI